jgi:ElaB/YqjD/DUF883 family membrane-anchored ribosome-binding protein
MQLGSRLIDQENTMSSEDDTWLDEHPAFALVMAFYFLYCVPALTLASMMDADLHDFVLVPGINLLLALLAVLGGGNASSIFISSLIAGFIVVVIHEVTIAIIGWNRRKTEEKHTAQLEQNRRQEADKKRLDIEASARAQTLARIAGLVSDTQLAAAKLPVILAAAESSLDTAQSEYDEGLYSPFWEAMEEAVQYLVAFGRTLGQIGSARQQYQQERSQAQQQFGGLAPSLARELVPFSLGVKVLPDPGPTKERMKRLYRQAQKRADFANIYEQRRNTTAIVEGFRSLGDAVNSLGDRIETEIRSLADTFEFRLADLGTAMRDAGEQMQRQQESLLAEARSWRAEASRGQAELVRVAHESAERAERGARERGEMLDNIQRRRKPSILRL